MVSLPKTREDLKRNLPIMDGSLDVRGLNGEIRILRDGYGIPHVRAGTTHARLLWPGLRDGECQCRGFELVLLNAHLFIPLA